MHAKGSANEAMPTPRSADLVDRFLSAQDSESFDAIWRADPELAQEALAEIATQAAKDGRMDLIDSIANMVGGLDILLQLAPQLLRSIVESDNQEAIDGLITRGPFAMRRRSKKDKPKHWEVDLVAAAIAMNAVQALHDAMAQDLLDPDFFFTAELDHSRTLMFEARHPESVAFLASVGLCIELRDDAGRSALAYALERAVGLDEDSVEARLALRMAEFANYDDKLSRDLVEGGLDKPQILEAGLRAGADPDARLQGSKGALRAAVERGYDRSAIALAKAGADPYSPDRDGICAHEAASIARKPDLRKAIVAAKVAEETMAAVYHRKQRSQILSAKKL